MVVEKAEQYIEDRSAALSWLEMQQLVAGILSAMGDRRRVAEPGPCDAGETTRVGTADTGLDSPRGLLSGRPGAVPVLSLFWVL
jgi:restriction system protein